MYVCMYMRYTVEMLHNNNNDNLILILQIMWKIYKF